MTLAELQDAAVAPPKPKAVTNTAAAGGRGQGGAKPKARWICSSGGVCVGEIGFMGVEDVFAPNLN